MLLARLNGNVEYYIVNLYTGRQSRPLTIWDLIKGIENDISSNKYPQNGIQYRSWGQNENKPARGKVVSIDSMKNNPVPENCSPTFIIQVLYRQNATWQGTIQWIEGHQMRQYRSVNELLKLMDEAMEMTPAEAAGDTP